MQTNDQARTPSEMGERLAFFLKWDGPAICEAFLAALTDANYHQLRTKLETIINDELKG